jgi:hypothetical protein
MRKFTFKLDTVQKVRKSKENNQLKLVAEAQQHLKERIDTKIQLQNANEEAALRREKLGTQENFLVQDYAIEDLFIRGNKQRIVGVDQSIFRAKKRVDQAM